MPKITIPDSLVKLLKELEELGGSATPTLLVKRGWNTNTVYTALKYAEKYSLVKREDSKIILTDKGREFFSHLKKVLEAIGKKLD